MAESDGREAVIGIFRESICGIARVIVGADKVFVESTFVIVAGESGNARGNLVLGLRNVSHNNDRDDGRRGSQNDDKN